MTDYKESTHTHPQKIKKNISKESQNNVISAEAAIRQKLFEPVTLNCLTTHEPAVFCGHSLEYSSWPCSGDTLFVRCGVLGKERLYYLQRNLFWECQGHSRRIFLLSTEDDAFPKAWKLLQE